MNLEEALSQSGKVSQTVWTDNPKDAAPDGFVIDPQMEYQVEMTIERLENGTYNGTYRVSARILDMRAKPS